MFHLSSFTRRFRTLWHAFEKSADSHAVGIVGICALTIGHVRISARLLQNRLSRLEGFVVGISADEDEAAYRKFIKNYGIDFVTVRDPSERIQHLYGTIQLPETYIIDRNGVLRRKFANAVDWNSPEVLQFLLSL